MKLKMKRCLELSFLITLIQIFLIINAIPAQSHIISQSDFSVNDLGINNYSENFIPELTGFFISLLSIKQIGVVSAQGNEEFNCCVQTNNGAICQDISSKSISPTDSNSCSNPLSGKCEETIECEIGTCIYNDGLSCAANSPKQECEDREGTWKKGATYEIQECIKGACVLAGDIEYVTEKQCVLLSESRGLEIDFRPGISEFEFESISNSIPKGACLLQGTDCRFVTIIECDNMNGNFFEDLLCSNTNLATNCGPSDQTMCVDDKIYFVDTCGNPANIYDSSKVNPDENLNYWEVVSEPECNIDLNDPDSIKSCGNCNIFLSSQCSEDSNEEVFYGDYICKNLRCTDENGKSRLNGEKWCVYDGFIGDGKDTVGSEHWIASCNNGKVEVNSCGSYRGLICEQTIIEENDLSLSTASCVVNEALKCLSYRPEEKSCSENAHCLIKNIDVDENFKFSVCSSEYPRGFDAEETRDSKIICSLANVECKVVYKKGFSGWKCIDNCNCERETFTEQMNDLCTSLGDCGSYVNYIGKGTENIQVENAPSIDFARYKSYANVVKGQYVDATKRSNAVSPIRTSLNGYLPEEANELLGDIGAIGAGYGIKLVNAYFAPVVFDFGPSTTAGISGVKAELSNLFSASSLNSFGVSAVSGFIGGFVADFVIDLFGLQGTGAQIVSLAIQIGFSALGSAISAELGFGGISWGAAGLVGIIALAVIAIVIALGIGKTKIVTVKFSCLPWQPPVGSGDCRKCNEDPSKTCTNYRCDSLGKACILINEHTTNPICQSSEKESNPPVISPLKVKTQGYEFKNQKSMSVKVRKANGDCIQEFIPVEFTLEINEYSQCKWSLNPTANYESMNKFSAEGTDYSLIHGFGIEGLSVSLLEANNISGDLISGFIGDLNVYVRCQDSFGNFNLNEYVINFCINSGPDLTPVDHSFTVTHPPSEDTLAYDVNEINLTMWINEPAECKYNIISGKNYNEMANSFNCLNGLTERELFGWPCFANLTKLQNQDKFYIKCKDQPWKTGDEDSLRNINTEDFVYTVYESESELKIDLIYVTFNELDIYLNQDNTTEIKGDGSSFSIDLKVETSGGSNAGTSLCAYESNNDFIAFFDSNSNTHKQELNLVNGVYNIPIECIDSAGNEASGYANFNLQIDNSPPKVVRVYYKSGGLSLTTDELAKCYVSFDEVKQCGFNINNADEITSVFSKEHSISWFTDKTYYIKCVDLFDNQNPSCAIKVNPSVI